MSLLPFTPPTLRLQVTQLDHVPDRYVGRMGDSLSLEDVRNDALCQKLTLDNRRLKKRTMGLALVVMSLSGILVGILTTNRGAQGVATKPAPAIVTAPMVQLPASAPVAAPASAPTSAAATAVQLPSSAPANVLPVAAPVQVPASAPISSAMAEEEVARRLNAIGGISALLKIIENPGAGMRTPVSSITVVPTIKTLPAKPAAQAETTKKLPTPAHGQQDVATTPAALPVFKIIDFFGFNTAVMISTGGDAERTYRVGDVLPTGETVTRIDSQAGLMQTNKRTINR